jgi:hypothetical protein
MGKVTKCLVWENFEKLGSMCVVNGVRGGREELVHSISVLLSYGGKKTSHKTCLGACMHKW